jgi:hypothetical protein
MESEMKDGIETLIMLTLAIWLIFSIVVFDNTVMGFYTERAVNQCEVDLPRHLHCEPVYGARVVPTSQQETIKQER